MQPSSLIVGFDSWSKRAFETEDFSPHRPQVAVVDSRIQYSREANCPGVSVVGRVRNESEIPWKELLIEVRYFDQSGVLIDAHSDRQYAMLVPAHGEAAFVIRSRAEKPEADYVKYEVEVKGARDARSRF